MSDSTRNLATRIIKDPKKAITKLSGKFLRGGVRQDRTYLKLIYPHYIGKKLDLENPRTFNEKLQWLKLYDRNPSYTNMVDKFEVRRYIEDKIGKEYLIPLIGVWDNFDDIDFSKLPNQFVLKCTHDSGGFVICTDKSRLNMKEVKEKINNSLKKTFYYSGREWVYKNIRPRIICEQLIVDELENDLKDYKFFCFDGEPKFLYVASNRAINTRFDFFDLDFERIPLKQQYDNSDKNINKPNNFQEMIDLSKILSENIPHIRVDFYNVNDKVYFGELTFYHFSGLVKFEPEIFDGIFGEYIDLEKIRRN